MGTSKNLIDSVPRDVAESVVEMKSVETVTVNGGNGEDKDSRGKDHELGSSNRVMNGDRLHRREVCGTTSQGTTVNGVVIECVVLINSGETGSIDEEDRDLRVKNDGLGSSDGVLNRETIDGHETMSITEQETDESSSNSVDGVVPETLIVINSQNACVGTQGGHLEIKQSDLGLDKVLEKPKEKVGGVEEQSCVIDVKHGDGDGGGGGIREKWDVEKVCRICLLSTEGSAKGHLSSEDSQENILATMTTDVHMTAASMDLVQLGCGCKDELGIAHVHCAEAWFKLKGNRLCEICGQTAKNVTGVRDNRVMEEWIEQRYARNYNSSSDGDEGCWQGPPFCNFLMACLVIAFVLPWFFRVDMF
ncbi:putative RING/FYVE/PHD zinc finger superfamily protein [Tripterygium wilfordii]|uniref:Putative RING/FYVE/PHD zinc finger superfamily protein n=1 Tax=Tripterygium wilfordii TaxID=458696 RepID=A0A7J7CQB5_TRIWF|nr:uncharacterized protein LOC120014586 [Tripterygium wilfordii]KAF5736251.1 putative RING/FYVE/PHD zinc finger superfamily protein [Tripterygium wilfordii]